MKWQDTQEIAIALEEKHPEKDNINLRYTDFHKWIIELDEFDDDPNKSNEKIWKQSKLLGLKKETSENKL